MDLSLWEDKNKNAPRIDILFSSQQSHGVDMIPNFLLRILSVTSGQRSFFPIPCPAHSRVSSAALGKHKLHTQLVLRLSAIPPPSAVTARSCTTSWPFSCNHFSWEGLAPSPTSWDTSHWYKHGAFAVSVSGKWGRMPFLVYEKKCKWRQKLFL